MSHIGVNYLELQKRVTYLGKALGLLVTFYYLFIDYFIVRNEWPASD